MKTIEQELMQGNEHDHSIPEWILNTKIPDGSITKDNEGTDGEYAAFRSNEDLDKWITDYSAAFQRAYDEVIDGSSLAFNDYDTIGSLIGSKVLEDLERRLYN